MALTARQKILYTDTCDVYQRVRTANSDGGGTPSVDAPVRIAQNVPYYHEGTGNFDEVTEVTRDVEANILTTDLGHFDAAATIPHTGWIRNTSGGGSVLNGRVYSILATDKPLPTRGSRRTNKQIHALRWVPKPPAGIS